MKVNPLERPTFAELITLLQALLAQEDGHATATQDPATATPEAATATPLRGAAALRRDESCQGGQEEQCQAQGAEQRQRQGGGQGSGPIAQGQEQRQGGGQGSGPSACPASDPCLDRARLTSSLLSSSCVEGQQAPVLKCNLPSARKVANAIMMIDIADEEGEEG